MAQHPLEAKYGLTSTELLDAVNARFRLKVALAEPWPNSKWPNIFTACRLDNRSVRKRPRLNPDFSILPGHETPLLRMQENSRVARQGAKPSGSQKSMASTNLKDAGWDW